MAVNAAPAPNAKGVYAAGNLIGTDHTVLYTGVTAAFTDGTVTAGATYYYHVFTVDKAFNYSPVVTVSATASVSTTPTILATASFSNFIQTIGSASPIQKATVSGSNLSGDITVTAPSGYEVSINGTIWTGSVVLSPVSGNISSTEVSVRLNAVSAGTFSRMVTPSLLGFIPRCELLIAFSICGSASDSFCCSNKVQARLFSAATLSGCVSNTLANAVVDCCLSVPNIRLP